MRLDGALEPRPRYGAAPFKGRFPLRRETREQCESQQQQSADEDDEATDAECLTNDNNNNNKNTINSRNNINNWPANRANLNLQPATLRTTKQRVAGPGAGNLKRCSMVATLKTRAPPSLMLMGQKDLHPGSRKAKMKAAGRKGARGGGGTRVGAGAGPGSRSGWERLNSSLVLLLISVIALMPPLTLGDDGDNFFAVNAFSAGPETTTPEFGKYILSIFPMIKMQHKVGRIMPSVGWLRYLAMKMKMRIDLTDVMEVSRMRRLP